MLGGGYHGQRSVARGQSTNSRFTRAGWPRAHGSCAGPSGAPHALQRRSLCCVVCLLTGPGAHGDAALQQCGGGGLSPPGGAPADSGAPRAGRGEAFLQREGGHVHAGHGRAVQRLQAAGGGLAAGGPQEGPGQRRGEVCRMLLCRGVVAFPACCLLAVTLWHLLVCFSHE